MDHYWFGVCAVPIVIHCAPIVHPHIVHPRAANFESLGRMFPMGTSMVLGGDWNARHVDYGDISNNFAAIETLRQLAIDENLTILSSLEPTCFRIPEGSFLDKFIVNDKCESMRIHEYRHCLRSRTTAALL